MDSLTQLTLGAALGEAVLGRQVGRKAPLWGAMLGTLPDLDVFIPMGGAVNDFVYHRGFSHSLFLLAFLSPVIAWLITRIHPGTKPYLKQWIVLAFVVLETSVLLDFLTIYGTQILWPFGDAPVAWPVLFIIDPLFTLPIVFGALMAVTLSRESRLGHRLNTAGLILSLVYLVWAFGAREHTASAVRAKLDRQGVAYSQLISSPTPFNTLLWRFVGIDNDRYFETYYSIFDDDAPLSVDYYPRNLSLMQGLENHSPVEKLIWFTRGYFALSRSQKQIVMTDLRMGSEPNYVFRFIVAAEGNPHAIPVRDEKLGPNRDWVQVRWTLKWVWERIWHPHPE